MVVSEMGEQWSPQTAPAIQAETHTIPIGSLSGKTFSVIGIRIPNVPQDVPVAKERKHPIRNTTAGRKLRSPLAEDLTSAATYSAAPSESVIAFRLHAKVRIRIAGTIDLKPSGMQPISSRKDISRRQK